MLRLTRFHPSCLAALAARGALAMLSLGTLAAPALAQSPAPLVRPGAWQVTPEAAGGATLSYQLCFRTGSMDDLKLLLPNLAAPAECPPVAIKADTSHLHWQIDCPALALKADARYTLSADNIEGRLVIEKGVPVSSTTQTIRARHAGTCPP